LELLPQLAAILGVFALLGFSLWWLRKRGAVQLSPLVSFGVKGSRLTGRQKILERVDALQLSPTHALSLVKMADRAILIGTSPAGFYLVESSSWKSVEQQQQREIQP
jgi:hypothetical protein